MPVSIVQTLHYPAACPMPVSIVQPPRYPVACLTPVSIVQHPRYPAACEGVLLFTNERKKDKKNETKMMKDGGMRESPHSTSPDFQKCYIQGLVQG